MSKTKPAKSYIFLDESGKPEIFSAKGINLVETHQASKYLVLAAVRHEDQLLLQRQVTSFKLKLLSDSTMSKLFTPGYSLDSFHAQKDKLQVKEKFYGFINSLEVKIDVLVVEKLKCYSSIQNSPGRLYGVMAGQLLKNLTHQADSTEIIFSRRDSRLKLQIELQLEVDRIRTDYSQKHPNLPIKIDLTYHHNPHYTHGGLQVADYIAHAIFQVYERDNRYFYEIVKSKIGKIQDICNKKYFTKSNPL